MTTIYKYPIEVKDLVHISMPKNAKVIHAGFDANNRLCIWAQVETENPLHLRAFRVVGTGDPFDMPHMWTHIGSVVQHPAFVWHIFAFNYDGGKVSE